jgi:hypothetical protein
MREMSKSYKYLKETHSSRSNKGFGLESLVCWKNCKISDAEQARVWLKMVREIQPVGWEGR